jgi:hypothetical protein
MQLTGQLHRAALHEVLLLPLAFSHRVNNRVCYNVAAPWLWLWEVPRRRVAITGVMGLEIFSVTCVHT